MCGIVASVRLPSAPQAGQTPRASGNNNCSSDPSSCCTEASRAAENDTYGPLAARLRESVERLRHRGPDGEGVWVSSDGTVGLGHSRLSIVDLSHGGDQPLHSDDGAVHAIVNGEVYNHDAIRERLAREHDYAFCGTSDSEVVLALYKIYGAPAFLDHMRGEFAFVIYDERDAGKVVAGRDRFGIKPLFWTEIATTEETAAGAASGKTLLFASECKAFLPLGWQPEWDVPNLFTGAAMSGDKFLFKGVRKILPGYWMEVDMRDGGVKHHQYWELDFANKNKVETRSLEEMIQGVRERIVEAVRLRLRADVPVGIYLSGGIDSSAVAGIVTHLVREQGVKLGNQNATQRISCFCIKFPSKSGFDESDIADRTAEWLGVSIEKIEMDETALAANFADAIYHAEHHHWDCNTVGKYALSTLPRRNGIPVVLSGEGADELFAGYPFLLPDAFIDPDTSFMSDSPLSKDEELRAKVCDVMRKELRTILMAGGFFDNSSRGSNEAASSRFRLSAYPGPNSGLFAPWIGEQVMADVAKAQDPARGLMTTLTPEVASKMRDEWHSLHRALYHYFKAPLANMILTCLGDRCEMAHSIEGRPPFLDHVLAEYVGGLPPSLKMYFGPAWPSKEKEGSGNGNSGASSGGGAHHPLWWGKLLEEVGDKAESLKGWELSEKWILREAMRPFVTQELYERRKHPYSAPVAFPRGGPFHAMITGLLTDEAVARLGFVDGAAVRRALEAGFGDGADRRAFRTLLIVASWVVLGQRFGVKQARPEDWQGYGAGDDLDDVGDAIPGAELA